VSDSYRKTPNNDKVNTVIRKRLKQMNNRKLRHNVRKSLRLEEYKQLPELFYEITVLRYSL